MALRPYERTAELFGPSPDAVLDQAHPARVLDELIESLPVSRLNRRYAHTAGEPAYDVRMLSKVILYSYMRGITSSREMARQCIENLAFRYLSSNQTPDHRTLSRYRRKARHLLRWVFAQTVRLGRQAGLVKLGLVALDSVKLTAHARADRKRTAEELTEELGKLDAYLIKVEDTDRIEDGQHGEDQTGEELPRALRSAKARRARLQEALDVLKADRARQQAEGRPTLRKDVIPSDPEAMWMKKQGRIVPGYSIQAAADAHSGMVVALHATRAQDDREQLAPMLQRARRTAGADIQTVVADNGYYSEAALVDMAQNGCPTQALVPDGRAAHQINRRQAVEVNAFHVDRFGYDEASGTLTCPAGHAMEKMKDHTRRGLPTTVYRGAGCAACALNIRCTKDKSGVRTVEVHRSYGVIRRAHERMRSADGLAMYKRRKEIIEPVFGQWQHNRGVRRLRLGRLTGASIEGHLLAIGHNVLKLGRNKVRFGKN
jgi:transposase